MTKRNTNIPRQSEGFIGHRNVKLVGGAMDGCIVDYFRDHGTGVHTEARIIRGNYRVGTYCIDPEDTTRALACDTRGNIVED
ncbi:hypothetical protein [Vibrio phage vB_VpS_PG28]|nr:hypothetical protein [Vibrio phage vB_VpS_PG28]